MQKYRLPQELTLDYRTWICGGGESKIKGYGHGKGKCALYNKDKYLCCIGQFSCQSGVQKKDLLNFVDPTDLLESTGIFVDGCLTNRHSYEPQNNMFVERAIEINDNELTTIAQKVRKLQSLCKKYRRTLVLKNFPKKILKELE